MKILFVEPFFGGSHARFARTLTEHVDAEWTLLTLPARHWKWRMRGSALWAARRPELDERYDLLLAGSYLPLAELIGLRPELARVPRILYFHENQLAYPSRDDRERDHHFGFTQIVSADAATTCVFNSAYNRDSFLDAARTLLARMPDAVPKAIVDRIEEKSHVLGVPLLLPDVPIEPVTGAPPVILWNHRWEHDKDPEAFFEALFAIDLPYQLIVCGERYGKAPPIFEEATRRLSDRILHFGFADDAIYRKLLARADLAVSTARHEFFGISMLEAVHHGARPLVPDRLAYVELFPKEYRYTDLAAALRALLVRTDLRQKRAQLVAAFGAPLLERYVSLFASAVIRSDTSAT